MSETIRETNVSNAFTAIQLSIIASISGALLESHSGFPVPRIQLIVNRPMEDISSTFRYP